MRAPAFKIWASFQGVYESVNRFGKRKWGDHVRHHDLAYTYVSEPPREDRPGREANLVHTSGFLIKTNVIEKITPFENFPSRLTRKERGQDERE